MFGSCDAREILARIDGLIDDLVNLDLTIASDDELLEFWQEWEAHKLRLAANHHRLTTLGASHERAQERVYYRIAALLGPSRLGPLDTLRDTTPVLD